MTESVLPPLPALQPDVPLDAAAPESSPDPGPFARALGRALDDAAAKLDLAAAAERAFAAGRGGLQEMVVARARADVTLALAAATASRTTQALTTILGMQV
jgi:flagellar hook-basal body complex protein FliE